MNLVLRQWMLWLVISGALGLAYEMVWLRRFSLWLGGTAVASAVTLSAFMAGLGLGGGVMGALAPQIRRPHRAYAACEASAALWAILFPGLLHMAQALPAVPGLAYGAAFALLLPPAAALGATWPLLTQASSAQHGAALYAANTTGAVAGVLGATFVALPMLGVRTTEMMTAMVGLALAGWALQTPEAANASSDIDAKTPPGLPYPALLAASATAGIAALGLELVWFRLAATALGATVQANGWVLAVFLGMMAAGAAAGRTFPRVASQGVGWGLTGLGSLALLGAALWGQLPYLVAAIWRLGGPEAMLPASAIVAAVGMAGAPMASGLAFSCAVRALGSTAKRRAGSLYAANTAGSIVGALVGGLWAIPALDLQGALWLFSGLTIIGGALILRRIWVPLVGVLIVLLTPDWDARLYAVGIHVRISDFADPSPRGIATFAREGWDLLSYDHGVTAAVAVGRSRKSGNLWLSINGKVDASTGADMPTQLLSAQLPLKLSNEPRDVLVVGLASGITAGEALRDPRVQHLTIAEIESAVISASRHFDSVSGAPLDDPRTQLVVEDARAWLSRSNHQFDVIISEPSNPWISGVSSLFTEEYWTIVHHHLREGGVACQWLQLYGMGPEELRGLLRTFIHVFPNAQLVQTIEGSDVLLLGIKGARPQDLPSATLNAAGIRALAGDGWRNTDDHPRVEWQAPRWLHYETGPMNAEAIANAGGAHR